MVDYAEFVSKLAKPGQAIVEGLTPETANIIHMAVGISGEAGELLDAAKKAAIYCKPLDRVNVIEELGDLEFYMEGLRQAVGVSREECINANIAKLMVRYEKGYSDKAAQDRADKVATSPCTAPAHQYVGEPNCLHCGSERPCPTISRKGE